MVITSTTESPKAGKLITCLLLVVLSFVLAACTQNDNQHRGFSLPEGDIEKGKLVFLQKSCVACHRIEGEEFAEDEWMYPQNRKITVTLGGEVTKLRTYGDLVTSVINPSHRIADGYVPDEILTAEGESRMLNYNDALTITELINLVTFLQAQYQLTDAPDTSYPPYVY